MWNSRVFVFRAETLWKELIMWDKPDESQSVCSLQSLPAYNKKQQHNWNNECEQNGRRATRGSLALKHYRFWHFKLEKQRTKTEEKRSKGLKTSRKFNLIARELPLNISFEANMDEKSLKVLRNETIFRRWRSFNMIESTRAAANSEDVVASTVFRGQKLSLNSGNF